MLKRQAKNRQITTTLDETVAINTVGALADRTARHNYPLTQIERSRLHQLQRDIRLALKNASTK